MNQRMYDQAALCDTGCCPVLDKSPDGKVTLHDPAFPGQGQFTFKNEEELKTFLDNAPKALAR